MSHQNVLILDFGGQYNQLIARRVRDLGVYCEILPFRKATVEKIQEYSPIGLIFTGGPNSVYAENAPKLIRRSLRWASRYWACATAAS